MRAFQDKRYDYYMLKKPLGHDHRQHRIGEFLLPAGAIFYHDKNDSVKGSPGDGCLKLCWTPEGNCYGWIAGDGMAFHSFFKNTDLFELVQKATIETDSEEVIAEAEKELSDIEIQIHKVLKELYGLLGDYLVKGGC